MSEKIKKVDPGCQVFRQNFNFGKYRSKLFKRLKKKKKKGKDKDIIRIRLPFDFCQNILKNP